MKVGSKKDLVRQLELAIVEIEHLRGLRDAYRETNVRLVRRVAELEGERVEFPGLEVVRLKREVERLSADGERWLDMVDERDRSIDMLAAQVRGLEGTTTEGGNTYVVT